jgi:hypothetical protein
MAKPAPHAPAARTVHVVPHGEECLVVPPAIVLAPNDTLKVVNHTAEDLVWIVADGTPFGTTVLDKVDKKGGAPHKARSVPMNAASGRYDYQIVMMSSGKKGKGHSDPMIIIDPEP